MPYRAQSELEAANLALSEIGEPPIGSFTDNNARARKVNMWFGNVRDDVLRAHDWGFACAYTIPAMDPKPALGHLKNRFVMPDDCLDVRDVAPYRPSNIAPTGISITDPNIIAELESLNSTPTLFQRDWDMEAAAVNPGDPSPAAMVMVTNIVQPIVRYTRRITIVRLWDAQFTTAFVKKLAGAIAPSIAKDINAGEKKDAEGEAKIESATRTDSREQSPKHVSRETLWVTSRYLGRGYRRDRG
jgi:hypothetical protein